MKNTGKIIRKALSVILSAALIANTTTIPVFAEDNPVQTFVIDEAPDEGQGLSGLIQKTSAQENFVLSETAVQENTAPVNTVQENTAPDIVQESTAPENTVQENLAQDPSVTENTDAPELISETPEDAGTEQPADLSESPVFVDGEAAPEPDDSQSEDPMTESEDPAAVSEDPVPAEPEDSVPVVWEETSEPELRSDDHSMMSEAASGATASAAADLAETA